MAPKEDDLKSHVYKFYFDHQESGKQFTAKTLWMKEFSKIYDTLKRYEDNLASERQSGSGRIVKIFTPKKVEQLKKDFDHKDGISQRQAAKKYGCSLQ
uniref:HTH psq-type domain-containing protein n=1 Tax=Acrobeloides nanus TaxID=290746 RepID=A0A914ENT6_9BILA